MVIRNNKSAAFAGRSVVRSRGALAKSLEKLSSGYAINCAADDAAGLAISEKMRRLTTGLSQAHKNSKDGACLIQIGEGALDEIHSMLNRAVELAGQSANGTYDNELDRKGLQAELDQLCDDIDRIAKSTNYNGVKLFQDEGLKYEQAKRLSTAAAHGAEQTAQASRASAQPGQAQASSRRTLDDLLEGCEKGDLNIVYVEQTGARVTATPTGQGGSTLGSDKDITITNPDGSTVTKKLSEILKTEIVPNTVQQVLDNYPAFGYLTGSTIGLGLEYYTKASKPEMENALAYITIGYSKTPSLGYADYTLGVNIDALDTDGNGTITREELVELEATISHEMIHAFMDEATTAGMIGFNPATNSFTEAAKFPTWFVEGMAQTASGPGGWVHPNSGGGLRIDKDSNAGVIKKQIQMHQLGTDVGGSGDYGTGYLACMYLGWKIASGGSPSTAVNAANISMGLTSLMNAVIGGKSLDSAIQELTNGAFSSTSDFQTKFNAADTEVTDFVHNLMTAKGDGRGGLVSGDLTDKDLVPDNEITDLKLFELNKDYSKVHNVYPSGYPVLSGGTVSGDNTRVPTDFQPAVTQKEYGDFIIKGNLPDDGSGGMQGIEWNDTTKTLTVTTGNDIEITMKSPTSGPLQNLVLDGGGRVTLNGVTADSLRASNDTQVSYEGKNTVNTITVDNGKTIDFQGGGQLKVNQTFTNNGTAAFSGGAVIVGSGTGAISGAVKVNGASVAAAIATPTAPDGTSLESIDVDWSKLAGLSDIASISVDGVQAAVLLSNADPGKLWLDPAKSHRVTFTDSTGVSKTLEAAFDAAGKFQWAEAAKPFTVTGGVVGTDYHYESDGTTLVIDTNTPLSISGGSIIDSATGTPLLGRIKIADNIGAVRLELNGVDCTDITEAKAGLDLGAGNDVTLHLASNSVNTLKGGGQGGAGCAGISLKSGTKLTIAGDDSAVLNAEGGYHSAGIGTDYLSTATGASIIINGGTIYATSGDMGAGIGAGYGNRSTKAGAFGNIEINGGVIKAFSKGEGAGIGGAQGASVGEIKITGGVIDAHSTSHGAGIGGGHNAYNGDITISGGIITAVSEYHGTGIGAGCSSNIETRNSKLVINGNAVIKQAQGGDLGAGMGASWYGNWGDIEISGNAVVESAKGGDSGAGIGSGSQGGSHVGNILINTSGSVTAEGGTNGVGIGSGHGYGGSPSVCGNIEIKQGTVKAKGSTDSTGIGAGRDSISGNITIGDKDNLDNKVIVTAEGGMTYNGGNIMAYSDPKHTAAGTVTITGNGTTVRPGSEGEGLYSTSGVVGGDNNPRYAYPVYLFHTDETTGEDDTLNAGVGLDASGGTGRLLPLDASKVDPSSIKISSEKGDSWIQGLSHDPLDSDYVFVWLKPEDQKLTIQYEEDNGSGGKVSKTVELDLKWYEDAGVFRIGSQPKPPDAQKPGYNDPDPVIPPDPERPGPEQPDPEKPVRPSPPEEELGPGGIILQIGAEFGETLTVPRFYLSVNALNMGGLDISTQENAWKSMPVIRNAINRVSSIRGTYGALYNRLEHNQNQLQHEIENVTDAEGRIRDLDMAEEMMTYTKLGILLESAQAMLAQANQVPQGVLQLLS